MWWKFFTASFSLSPFFLESDVAALSINVHWRAGSCWHLIQDFTNIACNIHCAFLIHQDEGMFLESDKKTTRLHSPFWHMLATPDKSLAYGFAWCKNAELGGGHRTTQNIPIHGFYIQGIHIWNVQYGAGTGFPECQELLGRRWRGAVLEAPSSFVTWIGTEILSREVLSSALSAMRRQEWHGDRTCGGQIGDQDSNPVLLSPERLLCPGGHTG